MTRSGVILQQMDDRASMNRLPTKQKVEYTYYLTYMDRTKRVHLSAQRTAPRRNLARKAYFVGEHSERASAPPAQQGTAASSSSPCVDRQRMDTAKRDGYLDSV